MGRFRGGRNKKQVHKKEKREQVPVGVGLHELKFKELANGEEEHARGNDVAGLLRQRLALIEGPARHELGSGFRV